MKKFLRSGKVKILIVFLFIAVMVSGSIATFAADALTVTATPNYGKGGIDLAWNINNSDHYSYKTYRKEESGNFEVISSVDFTNDIEAVNVLNVYPVASSIPRVTFTYLDGTSQTLPKSASMKVWMEGGTMNEGGTISSFAPIGINPINSRQLIKVTPLGSDYVNANPNVIWNYDVVMFGTWDINGSSEDQPNDALLAQLTRYLDAGFGVVAGHDTIGYSYTHGLNKIRNYFGIDAGCWGGPGTKTENYDYNIGWGYNSSQATVVREDVLTSYPWYLPVGTILNIPTTHTCANAAKGIVAMELSGGGDYNSTSLKESNYPGTGNSRYYVTRNNNAVMVQTGHSNCQSTEDERKVLANAVFYLKQLTERTDMTDNNVKDKAAPKSVTASNITRNGTSVSLALSRVDVGTKYSYYVEGINKSNGSKVTSNTATATYTSEVKGYSYIVDSNATTDVDSTIDTTSSNITCNLTGNKYTYLHVRAIDNAGNVGPVSHVLLHTNVPPTLELSQNPTEWTNKDVTISAVGSDVDGTVTKIKCPNGSIVNASSTNYTVPQNGTYEFVATDNSGDTVTKSIKITNIDKVDPTGVPSITQPSDVNKFAKITINADDDASGVLTITLPDGRIIAGDTATYNVTENGTYSFIIEDVAGNKTTVDVPVTIKAGGLVVKYIDVINGNEEIAERYIQEGNLGDAYTAPEKKIEGYKLFKAPTNAEGTLTIDKIELVYEYKKISAGVDIKYIDDITGESLIDEPIHLEGCEKDPYTSSSMEIVGYKLEKYPDNPSGEMKVELTTVEYRYRKESPVTTKHIDLNAVGPNNQISELTNVMVKQGYEYKTSSVYVPGYELIEVPENANGVMGREGIEVVYGYKKVSGGVDIIYKDKVTGRMLQPVIHKPLDTTGHEADEYTSEKLDFAGYEIETIPENANGKMTVDTIQVIYEYLKLSEFKVRHIDLNQEEGNNNIVPVHKEEIKEGYPYSSSALEDTKYVLISAPEVKSGTMGRENIELVYKYKKVSAGVNVVHVDDKTGDVLESSHIEGNEKDRYKTTAVEIPGYELEVTPTNKDGEMTVEPITVEYRYRKLSDVVIECVDENTNEVFYTVPGGTYKEGYEYETLPPVREGYVVITKPENRNGVMGKENITVRYGYKKVSNGIVANYVDIKTDELIEQEVYTGNENDQVKLEEKEIYNYVFVRTDAPEDLRVTLEVEPQTYTFYYKRRVTMTVICKDKVTGEIFSERTRSGVEGDEYIAEADEVEGYIVDGEDTVTGIYDRKTNKIVFEYVRASEGVSIKHVDIETKEVLDKDIIYGNVGESYNTSKIENEKYDFVSVEGNANGKFEEKLQEVTYYYKKKTSKVIIKYVDKDGNVVSESELVGKVDDPYKVEVNVPKGYKVVETSKNEEGNYTLDPITVTILLEKIPGKIIINITDESGNILTTIEKDGYEGETIEEILPKIDGFVIPEGGKVVETFVEGEKVITIVYEKPTPEIESPDTSDINVISVIFIAITCLMITVKTSKKYLV